MKCVLRWAQVSGQQLQAERKMHVMFKNTTQEPPVSLAQELWGI